MANELGLADCLVRSTEFSYAQNAIATVTSSVTQSGYVRRDGSYLQVSLSPLELAYSQALVETDVREGKRDGVAGMDLVWSGRCGALDALRQPDGPG